MLGWVITCHGELAQEMLDSLESRFARLNNAERSTFATGLALICSAA